ncbi:MAG: hypothetical protein WCJ01_01215 [Ignavibacteria bacterium]
MKHSPKKIQILLFLLSFILALTSVYAGIGSRIYMLKRENRQSSQFINYKNSLGSVGFEIQQVGLNEFISLNKSGEMILIVPGDIASLLSREASEMIAFEVRNGCRLITEEYTGLSAILGIEQTDEHDTVEYIRDKNHPDIQINYKYALDLSIVECPKGEILCRDNNENPVAFTGSFGKGKFIYLNAPLDNPKEFGYGRFPFLHETVTAFFDVKPFVKRNKLVAYLDLGYHETDEPVELMKRIKSYGISELHISGWYDIDKYGEQYKALADNAHLNGILVYLWLELPMVTSEFWNAHPEWRERTALNKDAHLDWRKLMSLESPKCFNEVAKYLKKLVHDFEWDGIDIAEFYFESLEGPKMPASFTPMSSFVRNDYKRKYDYDPIEIFNKSSKYYIGKNDKAVQEFLDYRVELCTNLNRKLLKFFRDENLDKAYDIYLTQIANPFDEKLNKNIGVDADEFVKLQKEFGFTMQAEDPYPLWVLGPDRYAKIGSEYRRMLGSEPVLTVDINIVSEGRDNPYPTSVQTGLEFTQLLSCASLNADRVCVYAVNTVHPSDYKFAPYSLAVMCKVNRLSETEFTSESPVTFVLESEKHVSAVRINGKKWACFTGQSVIVPKGSNKIEIIHDSTDDKPEFRITDISCDIQSCDYSGRNITLAYYERRGVYVTLNKKPLRALLNGKETELPVYDNLNTGEYIISCPKGRNTIEFVTEL